jgi:hypothetical protein
MQETRRLFETNFGSFGGWRRLRKKRFLDPVGKLFKMTFGTLDQEDRVYYDSQLLDMWINQENLYVNNEKQVTSILEIYNAAIWKFFGI